MLVVVVLIDGFAAVPIRFVAPANIFSKISRATGIGRANWKFVKNGVAAFTVTRGLRIAQLVVAAVAAASFVEADALPPTERGSGGFGSTGVSE